MSAPQIPPRPTRSQQQQSTAPAGMDVPKIPPRPTRRAADQSRSPNRDSFPRSPLNDVPVSMSLGNKDGSLYSNSNESGSNFDLPQRPPSVSLPSVGQEGSEYADIEYSKVDDPALKQGSGEKEPEQTRNVGSDLPLHAPRPSFSSSTAKARVSTVTRTDSNQAAAVGIGKASTPISGDDKNPHSRPLKPRTSFSTTESTASTERPGSQAGDSDHGIPEIGQRVPMYPDAGDVQAPSASPYAQTFPSGIGFHNDGRQKPGRHHDRARSGKEVFHGPPGSYGLHGHGVAHTDRFEKAWYDKHPDALVKEENGLYGPGLGGSRGEWALSSDDLNKIVRETASRGAGFGTSTNVAGLPNEQIGYMASEEYVSRINTPQSATYHNMAHSNHSQTHVDSPLRKTSFPVDIEAREGFEKSNLQQSFARPSTEHALESETEDDEIHIPPPTFRTDKYGGKGYNPPTEDLGPHGGNTEAEGGWIEEIGYGVPILASDEVAKEPGSEFLQPAVSPVQERRGSNYYAGYDSDAPPSYQSGLRNGSRSGSASNSRPGSRPVSVHGSLPGLSRFISHDEREDMHTSLEDVDEYEPLFPEEEVKEGRPIPATNNFKRREMLTKRRFPSQDIWEDTPNSLQLQATVTTPEPEERHTPVAEAPSTVFETPEIEGARKGEVSEHEKAKLIPREERLAKSNFKPHLLDKMQRPELKQRFPSRDIWEDSPDSARLETTVEAPQSEDLKGPIDEGLVAGAVVRTSGRPGEDSIVGDQAREGATAGAAAIEKRSIPPGPAKSNVSKSGIQALPSLPARPPKRLHQVPPAEIPPPSKASAESSPTEIKQASSPESRKAPILPERPKPQVPARPSKPIGRESSENVPLSKATSPSSTGSGAGDDGQGITSLPATSKPKPAVPSRPAGSKIAALKAGFLSDLDKRLQLGPQAPPKPQEKTVTEDEPDAEKAPLADARKGRARGPARRKPAAASVPLAGAEEREGKVEKGAWGIQEPWTVWEIDNSGVLTIMDAASALPITKAKRHDEPPYPPTSNTGTEEVEDAVMKGQKEIEARAEAPLGASAPVLYSQKPDVVPKALTELSNSSEHDKQGPAAATVDDPHTAKAMSAVGEKSIVEDAQPENKNVEKVNSLAETEGEEADL